MQHPTHPVLPTPLPLPSALHPTAPPLHLRADYNLYTGKRGKGWEEEVWGVWSVTPYLQRTYLLRLELCQKSGTLNPGSKAGISPNAHRSGELHYGALSYAIDLK